MGESSILHVPWAFIVQTSRSAPIGCSMYARMTEINGAEPMPAEVFKERKRILNELSKM